MVTTLLVEFENSNQVTVVQQSVCANFFNADSTGNSDAQKNDVTACHRMQRRHRAVKPHRRMQNSRHYRSVRSYKNCCRCSCDQNHLLSFLLPCLLFFFHVCIVHTHKRHLVLNARCRLHYSCGTFAHTHYGPEYIERCTFCQCWTWEAHRRIPFYRPGRKPPT